MSGATYADGMPASTWRDTPAAQKATWEQIEYPAILRQARELDARRAAEKKEKKSAS